MKKLFFFLPTLFLIAWVCSPGRVNAWGFFAHQRINRLAVFTLPPGMIVLFKPQIEFITAHAVDPDKRKFILPQEGPRHFIDMDHYGSYPYADLPRRWQQAVEKYTADSLNRYGVLPWNTLSVFYRLTAAFKAKDQARILKLSTDLGHYIADAHVPLHACSNYNGQFSGQEGIHALWESAIPEMLADSAFDLWIGKARYIRRPGEYIWKIILESAREADTVLRTEKELQEQFPAGSRYTFIMRKNKLVKTYSPAYIRAFNERLKGMVERRYRQSIRDVASFWYTAWVDAGQPELRPQQPVRFPAGYLQQWRQMEDKWQADSIGIIENE